MDHAFSAAPARRPVWALPVVVTAVIAVAIAAVAGVRGLGENPVTGTDPQGVTTLHGTFEPFGCGAACTEGYVQAGARSAFVIFPPSCSAPAPGSVITVRGRLDRAEGSQTYDVSRCAG